MLIVGKSVTTFTTAMVIVSVVMKQIADAMVHWCDERNIPFRRQYLIDSARFLSAGEPSDIVVGGNGAANLLSFYSGSARSDLITFFLCSHARKIMETNSPQKIHVTYIVKELPRPEVSEWAQEQGVSFCLDTNALNRMESLVL